MGDKIIFNHKNAYIFNEENKSLLKIDEDHKLEKRRYYLINNMVNNHINMDKNNSPSINDIKGIIIEKGSNRKFELRKDLWRLYQKREDIDDILNLYAIMIDQMIEKQKLEKMEMIEFIERDLNMKNLIAARNSYYQTREYLTENLTMLTELNADNTLLIDVIRHNLGNCFQSLDGYITLLKNVIGKQKDFKEYEVILNQIIITASELSIQFLYMEHIRRMITGYKINNQKYDHEKYIMEELKVCYDMDILLSNNSFFSESLDSIYYVKGLENNGKIIHIVPDYIIIAIIKIIEKKIMPMDLQIEYQVKSYRENNNMIIEITFNEIDNKKIKDIILKIDFNNNTEIELLFLNTLKRKIKYKHKVTSGKGDSNIKYIILISYKDMRNILK
jgi:hypothetical protein